MAAKLFACVVLGLSLITVAKADESAAIAFNKRLQAAKETVKRGDLIEGIQLLHKLAAESGRQNPVVLSELGDAFRSLGEVNAAINAYAGALRVPGQHHLEPRLNVSRKRGELYLASDRFREAAEDFARSAEGDPTNSELYYLRGLALLNMAKHAAKRDNAYFATLSEAVDSFDSAIRYDEDNSLAYFERGMAKMLTGQDSEAKDDLVRAVSGTPDPELAQRLVEWALRLNEANKALGEELATVQAETKTADPQPCETAQGISEMAETLREIRDLLRRQVVSR